MGKGGKGRGGGEGRRGVGGVGGYTRRNTVYSEAGVCRFSLKYLLLIHISKVKVFFTL